MWTFSIVRGYKLDFYQKKYNIVGNKLGFGDFLNMRLRFSSIYFQCLRVGHPWWVKFFYCCFLRFKWHTYKCPFVIMLSLDIFLLKRNYIHRLTIITNLGIHHIFNNYATFLRDGFIPLPVILPHSFHYHKAEICRVAVDKGCNVCDYRQHGTQ